MVTKYFFGGCFLFFISFSASCQYQRLEIVPLSIFNNSDTTLKINDTMIFKGYTYIVKNYRDNSETGKTIDSFVYTIKDTSFKNKTSVVITFYRESAITNSEHLSKNKRDLDRYSNKNDVIYTYSRIYQENKYTGWQKLKFKNGSLDSPDNIIIEDIKPVDK